MAGDGFADSIARSRRDCLLFFRSASGRLSAYFRDKQANQDRNDRNHHQQLNERAQYNSPFQKRSAW
jgi:hypothetical protein